MFFNQIYDELKKVNENNDRFEKLLRKNFKAILKNRKKEETLHQRIGVLEETLHQRIGVLEEENIKLKKEFERVTLNQEKNEREIELCKEHNIEMSYKHNVMLATINTMISEINYVIAVLNIKNEEN